MASLVLVLALYFAASTGTAAPCSPSDHPEECKALVNFGAALSYASWTKSTGWLSSKTYCSWHGVSCDSRGHVTAISLQENGLNGKFPDLSAFAELQIFVADGQPLVQQ